MKTIFIILIFIFVLVVAQFSLSYAMDYYISPSGSDSTGAGTISNPWRTFTTANSHLVAGDTLIYKNGTYDYSGSAIDSPVSGASGNLTTIQAETDGGVINSGAAPCVVENRNYIGIYGFKFLSSGANAINFNHVDYSEVKRCAGRTTGGDGSNAIATFNNGCDYNLIEDCWFWGHGRVGFMFYGAYGDTSTHNIARRVLVRWEGTAELSQGCVGFQNYGVYDNIMENCIAIDFNDAPTPYGAFRQREDCTRNNFYGCIAIKTGNFYPYFHGNSGSPELHSMINCVGIAEDTGYVINLNDNPYISIDRCTLLNGSSAGIYASDGNNVNIKNTLFKNTVTGSYAGRGTISYCHFDSSGSIQGTNASSGDSQLLYPVRIELGSACKATGEGRVDKGANIVQKYVNGVLTSDDLWPWPYEERIKADMSEAFSLPSGCSPSTTITTRGFCADFDVHNHAQTLTNYIWEYFGNTTPSEYVPPTPNNPGGGGGGGGGCLIATAAYGSKTAGEVQILTKFRDKHLLTNKFGRGIVKLYYKLSPPVANYIRNKEWACNFIKEILQPIIWVIENKI